MLLHESSDKTARSRNPICVSEFVEIQSIRPAMPGSLHNCRRTPLQSSNMEEVGAVREDGIAKTSEKDSLM
jgi:hypothetical protein